MKKTISVFLKILAGIILALIILLISVPLLFKDKIRAKVEQAINSSVNATVKFDDYNLGFFKNFPNLAFSLTELSVVGEDKFQNDTLAAFRTVSLVFDLSSLFKKTGYEVKSILADKAIVNAIVLKDGSVNWDIMKDTSETVSSGSETASDEMRILLNKVVFQNSTISYIDNESSIKTYLNNVDFTLKGDMTLSETDLQISFRAGEFTYIMDDFTFLNKTLVDSKIDVLANLDSWKFTFRENYITINDLKMYFSGVVIMPEDDIETDIQFRTDNTAFKALLSLIPAVYMNDYKDLSASGEFNLSGSAKGVYSDADSTLPDITLALAVENGLISYPALPEQIKNINIKSDLFIAGKDMDKTTVSVDPFHMELAGSPFDMKFSLKTPISDPDFKGSMIGKIDLSALSKALPMDSISLSGIIDMSVMMEGRLSMVEKEQYESFKASGSMSIKNMLVAMAGYPEIRINESALAFTPAFASMTNTSLNIGGKSDFLLNGKIENYIPYLFSDNTLKGNLSLRSRLIDASEIMSAMVTDTSALADTTSLAVIQVPRNIDFDFNAVVDKFTYDAIAASDLKGHIVVKDGILSLREAMMSMLGGTIAMNADYDTRDTLKPFTKASLLVKNMGIKEAFNTFNTVKKLAPAAKGIDGKINAEFAYESLLGADMMPLPNTITGSGKLNSEQVTLVESQTFNMVKQTLKLGENYTNTFKDVKVSFRVENGRIIVSPFDVKTGNLKMNISGDHGIDQTLNYFVKTEIPRSDLGSSVNSFIDNLSSQASAFGISFKPSEVLKLNLKVSGTFSKPLIAPVFGNSSGGSGEVKAETVNQVLQQTLDKTLETSREKARIEAEKQAAQLVKEAEQQGQALRDEAAKAAETIRKEADAQGKKLIENAASRSTLEKLGAQKGADALKKEADKRANQLIQEADIQSKRMVEEAKIKADELVKKI